MRGTFHLLVALGSATAVLGICAYSIGMLGYMSVALANQSFVQRLGQSGLIIVVGLVIAAFFIQVAREQFGHFRREGRK